MFQFVNGTIFNDHIKVRGFSLAQCISSDTKSGMYRGISVEFLKEFPELNILRTSNLAFGALGTAVPIRVDKKFIYNLVTKPLAWMKPTLTCVYFALQSMRAHAQDNGILNIAVPLLGSGCDRLNFEMDVFPMLESVFKNTNIAIHIFYLGNNPILEKLEIIQRLVIFLFSIDYLV